ncbi:unnamed protein product [Arctia plantaginis]|uniref:Uncharacterized protein n=1 Tax=Arctia plantaginis TaxID=874455 RepID=A0A8S0YYM1_ARCPL|nr:unnamed protein product [Arctia plantaginis]
MTHYLRRPHPSLITSSDYELLEDMEPGTIALHRVVGPQVYTDGSKMGGESRSSANLVGRRQGDRILHIFPRLLVHSIPGRAICPAPGHHPGGGERRASD